MANDDLSGIPVAVQTRKVLRRSRRRRDCNNSNDHDSDSYNNNTRSDSKNNARETDNNISGTAKVTPTNECVVSTEGSDGSTEGYDGESDGSVLGWGAIMVDDEWTERPVQPLSRESAAEPFRCTTGHSPDPEPPPPVRSLCIDKNCMEPTLPQKNFNVRMEEMGAFTTQMGEVEVAAGRTWSETATKEALKAGNVSISEEFTAPGPITVKWCANRAGPVEKIPWSSDLLDSVALGDISGGSALFYALSRGRLSAASMANIIDKAASGKSRINFIVWVNYHWVATQLQPGVSWKVYDSSRNRKNEVQIRQWAEDIGLPIPTFPAIPQQREWSDECGIFAFLMMHQLMKKKVIPELRPLPPRLQPRRPSLKKLITMMQDIPKAASVGWSILQNHYRECDRVVWTVGGEGENIYPTGTHLRVHWHWTGKPEVVYDERALVVDKYGTTRRTIHVLNFEAVSELSGSNRILPLPADSNVTIVSHEIDDRPAPAMNESDGNAGVDDEGEDAEEEEEHHRFYEEFLTETKVETFHSPDSRASTGLRPITVGEFLKAKIRPLEDARASCPTLVWTAMVTETRRGHIKELMLVQEFAKTLPANHPLDTAIARYAKHARDTRNLAWSSVSRILQSLIGAFAVFPNYATGDQEEFPPIFINRWPGIRDSLKTAKRLTNVVGTREPVAATARHVTEALHFVDEPERVFLQMCWLTSQRPGDVVHVRTDHVKLLEGKAVIRFAEGKNHASTDQYAIHCVVPEQWLPAWRKQLAKRRKFVFDVPSKTARTRLMRNVREALRKSTGGKRLEMKSLRRGSLQTMAENGASVAELLKFSRHQDAKTLRRYLAFDEVADAENQGAMEHTRVLGGGFIGQDVVQPEPWCTITPDGDVFFGAPPKPRSVIDRSKFKYHIKDVPPIDLEEMSKLAALSSEAVQKDWEEARHFLEDPSIYQCAPKGHPLKSRVRKKMIKQLRKVGQIREVRAVDAKNFCVVFVIPEDEKVRWRIIKHPEAINLALEEIVDELKISKTNATRRTARVPVIDYPGCIEFDFAGYFDQFILSDAVADHFVFQGGDKYYAPRRLPMGVSFAVAVATAATRVLTHGIDEGLDVAVSHQIDNVRIAGTKEHCELVADRFLNRCHQAGVTLNDFNREKMYSTTNDFMGDEVNFASKTIKCRKKQQDRLAAWLKKLKEPTATFRDWFASYGTASYMAEALGVTPAQHQKVRLFMRDLARAVSRSPLLWDEQMPFSPPWAALSNFFDKIRSNRPARLVAHPSEVVSVFVDASDWGYGALYCGPDGEAKSIHHKWTAEERVVWSFEKSTVAEPRAINEVTRWAQKDYPDASIHVFTDHQPFVDAFWRCGSFSPGYNDALLELGATGAPVVLQHIAGKSMPADGLSRGLRTVPTPEEWSSAANWVKECALSTRRYYRILGGGTGARTFSVVVPPATPRT